MIFVGRKNSTHQKQYVLVCINLKMKSRHIDITINHHVWAKLQSKRIEDEDFNLSRLVNNFLTNFLTKDDLKFKQQVELEKEYKDLEKEVNDKDSRMAAIKAQIQEIKHEYTEFKKKDMKRKEAMVETAKAALDITKV